MACWGVDSCSPITSSYLADVKTWGGTTPTFWGRYLTNNSVCPNGQLSGSEVTLCKDNNIGIIPVVNNWNLSELSTESYGTNAANHCIDVALDNGNGVGVPEARGIAVFLDIEGNNPSISFFKGFANTMSGSEYVGGIYGNQTNFGNNLCTAAADDGKVTQLVIWGNQPIVRSSFTPADNAPSYAPDSVPCGMAVQGWQYYLGSGSYPDEDLVSTLGFVWTF